MTEVCTTPSIQPTEEDRLKYDCPEWCRRLDHDADLVDGFNPPTHYGPMFGSVGVQETSGCRAEAVIYAGDEVIYLTQPSKLLALAKNLLDAASWLVEQEAGR